MCDALREIMKEDLDERYRAGENAALETAAMGMLRENISDDTILRVTTIAPERLAVLRTMM